MSTTTLPTRSVILTATPQQIQNARRYAGGRHQGHNHCRRPEEDAGTLQANYMKDVWGVLGEMLVRDAFRRQGWPVEADQLVTDTPPVGADIVLHGVKLEVKTCPARHRYWCVNERQRRDPQKRPDYYLPVVFETEDRATLRAPVPVDVVASWELRKAHSAYRSCHIANLSPLGSLADLLHLLPVIRQEPTPQAAGRA